MPRFLPACGFIVAFLVLAAGSRELWQHRFAPLEGAEPVTLQHTPEGIAKIVGGAPELPADKDHALILPSAPVPPQVIYRWETLPRSANAYIAVETGCEGLEIGKQYDWQDGRIFVRWFGENGQPLDDFLPVWSGRGNRALKFREMIMPMRRGGGLPRLIIENLGSTGSMTVKSLVVQPVAERPWIRGAAVGMIAAWLVLLGWGLKRWVAPRLPWWRPVAAAGVSIVFVWYGSFPGPWVPWYPLQERYPIQPEPVSAPPPPPAVVAQNDGAAPASPEATTPPVVEVAPPPKPPEPPAYPAAAKGPPQKLAGEAVRKFFTFLPDLKIWVHFLAFAGLAAALAFLTGSRRAAYVAGGLAVLSEFCEWAFGYGFDSGDVMDLVMDATAILAGMIFWKYATRWVVRWLKLRRG